MTQRKPSNVSVVILALNEAVNIVRCIRSASWADEVYVVDSGSTDGTLDLATRSGAHVVSHRQEGAFNIAEQRNWAMTNIVFSSEWVLFLDADEEVTPDLAEEIIRATHDGQFNSFELTPKYLFQGRWMRRTMGYPNWHARLVRRDGPRFTGGVWEDFDRKDATGRIEIPYLHHGNSKGFSDWLERHDRYSTHDAAGIDEFLRSGSAKAFGTERRLGARILAARLWRARPVLRFIYMYFLRGGFLDGSRALRFCLRYALYEYMTVEKVHELRVIRDGEEL